MCRRAVDAAQSSPLWLSNALVNLSLAGVFLGTDEAIEVALDAATRAVPAARRIGSRYYEGGAWGHCSASTGSGLTAAPRWARRRRGCR